MNKFRLCSCLLVTLVLVVHHASAQELLSPLQTSPAVSFPSNPGPQKSSPLVLPFFEDFSTYEGAPRHDFFEPSAATVSRGFDPYPPTVGLLVLDALDADGNIYPSASTGVFPADTLTSLPIRLDSLGGLWDDVSSPDDSICFSFFYLPGGGDGVMWQRVGDAPEGRDSLVLEFWNPADLSWHHVWSRGGTTVDSLLASTGQRWQFVALHISDPDYLSPQFRFRFRNYCSLDDIVQPGMVADCDQWFIDYITIEPFRSLNNPYQRDVAFVSPAPSFLKNYRAMPARQYLASDMADHITMTITNRYSDLLAAHYTYDVFDASGNSLASYDGGFENVPSFLLSSSYQSEPAHAAPPVTFVFPSSSQPASFSIRHVIREGVAGDDHPCNDTLLALQVFDNYYAYDDGTPENGYGAISAGSKVAIACRFDLNVPDTLAAVDLFFNRTRNHDNEDVSFSLAVWDNAAGRPGSLIYTDPLPQRMRADGLNRFRRYLLHTPVVISDTVFVGFIQSTNAYINLGFDRNTDVHDRLFYLSSAEWQGSILSGAPMIRPCFGSRALLDAPQPSLPSQPHLTLFPNPASCRLSLSLDDLTGFETVEIFDHLGRCLLRMPFAPSVDVSSLPSGLYLLSVSARGQRLASLPFVLTH